MLKFHLFPRDTGIDAVLGPPKLPSGLELRSAALGQFWRPLDGIFSRVPRKKAEFWPKMLAFSYPLPLYKYFICD